VVVASLGRCPPWGSNYGPCVSERGLGRFSVPQWFNEPTATVNLTNRRGLRDDYVTYHVGAIPLIRRINGRQGNSSLY
jgi:hypothetical protein